MKFLIIFLIFLGFLLGISNVNASCLFNYDWPSAPCLDQNNPELVEKAKKEWSRYADIKTDRFLELYKNEMINAI